MLFHTMSRPQRFRVHAAPSAMLAGIALLVTVTTALCDWVIVVPPSTPKRDCSLVYDQSAPIAKWSPVWPTHFATSEACETIRSEMVRRTTAPGRRERALALAQKRQAEAFEGQQELRRQFKKNPEALRLIPRRRKSDPALCEGYRGVSSANEPAQPRRTRRRRTHRGIP
jgi:hypothetical protein